jgi:chemotaxis protein methyltransferase CheR
VRDEDLPNISALQGLLLRDRAAMGRFLYQLSVNTTTVFRDPRFFQALRSKVVPILRTYPFVRIWHAGCSTGEEVYSTAIVLQEEGLYDRCRIYATDMDDAVLRKAREGIFSLDHEAQFASNYRAAGGQKSLDVYYTSAYGNAMFKSSLKENIVFSQHNLAVDGSFNEFHVILCRNVMIYFAKPLQERVHRLIYDSLAPFGVVGLGNKETMQFTPHEKCYEQLEPGCRLYKRIC